MPIVTIDHLKIAGLAAQRGGRRLFAPLTLTLERGCFAALRGPNGAGKTSLLRTLAGLLQPGVGRVEGAAAGQPLDSDALALATLLLGHAEALKSARTAREELAYWVAALGGDPAALAPAVRRLGLERVADRPCRTLSAGQRRRAALGRLLVCPRPLWLLDEPATSLDAAGKDLLCQLIAEHCAAGGMVLAALHEALPLAEHRTIVLEPAA